MNTRLDISYKTYTLQLQPTNSYINMHQRSELEQPRTLAEMRVMIDMFENDHNEYSNTAVRRRTGVAKAVIEEYFPLFLLAQILPGVKSARLTAVSHPGPDAVLQFDDESHATVQITCAGDNESTALQRKLINDRQVVFGNQLANRNRKTGEITQSGQVLTTRTENTIAAIDEVLLAIEKKKQKYRAGTQFLLIGVRRSEITMTEDWQQQLRSAVSVLTVLPYERIYVATVHTCFVCK